MSSLSPLERPKARLPRLAELWIACRERRALQGEHALVVWSHEDTRPRKPERVARLGETWIVERGEQRCAHCRDRRRREVAACDERQVRRQRALSDDSDLFDQFGARALEKREADAIDRGEIGAALGDCGHT